MSESAKSWILERFSQQCFKSSIGRWIRFANSLAWLQVKSTKLQRRPRLWGSEWSSSELSSLQCNTTHRLSSYSVLAVVRSRRAFSQLVVSRQSEANHMIQTCAGVRWRLCYQRQKMRRTWAHLYCFELWWHSTQCRKRSEPDGRDPSLRNEDTLF